MDEVPFVAFPKIARLSRNIIVTEKIDGTNAQIWIDDLATTMKVGSRKQWIDEKADNFGFHRWCMDHKDELMKLGPGAHFGEWWGAGIQRRYGLSEKRFSLFNTTRWGDGGKEVRPSCCHSVPVLWQGNFNDLIGPSGDSLSGCSSELSQLLHDLKIHGSVAAPGFMDPEGIVVFHEASKQLFKKTINGDEKPKGSTEEG